MSVEHGWQDVYGRQHPFGMQDYATWFKPISNNGYYVNLSDIDGVLQSNKLNASITIEIKPLGGTLTKGQELSLKWFSGRNDKCYSICIFDPWYNDNSGEKRDTDTMFPVFIWRGGVCIAKTDMTVPELYQCFTRWWETGVFYPPIIN